MLHPVQTLFCDREYDFSILHDGSGGVRVKHVEAEDQHAVLNFSLESYRVAVAASQQLHALPAAQLVDFGFDLKKLDSLKAAINQARHTIQESQANKIPVDEQQKR